MKESFVFRKEWKEAISELPDNIRLEVYEAIIDYGTTGKISDISEMAKIAFNFIKKTLDKDTERYEEIKKIRSDAGKRGNEKRWKKSQKVAKIAKASKTSQKVAKIADNDNLISSKEDKSSYEDNGISLIDNNPLIIPPKPKSNEKFIKPTIEEVKAYIREKAYNIDAETFWNFYEANGWVQGSKGKPIVNWKACVATWAKNERRYAAHQPSHSGHPTDEQLVADTIKLVETMRRERESDKTTFW